MIDCLIERGKGQFCHTNLYIFVKYTTGGYFVVPWG